MKIHSPAFFSNADQRTNTRTDRPKPPSQAAQTAQLNAANPAAKAKTAQKKPPINKTDRIKHAADKAFMAAMEPVPLIRDCLLAAGFTILVSAIPPHIQGIAILPLLLTTSALHRGTRKFKEAYRQPDIQEILRAKQCKSDSNWVYPT